MLKRFLMVMALAGLIVLGQIGCGGSDAKPQIQGSAPTLPQMSPGGAPAAPKPVPQ
jgi:hypothetical protein